MRRNATKLVLSMEDSKPTIQGWLVKVKNGHAKQSWCVLIGKMFLSFKSPTDTVIKVIRMTLNVTIYTVYFISYNDSFLLIDDFLVMTFPRCAKSE